MPDPVEKKKPVQKLAAMKKEPVAMIKKTVISEKVPAMGEDDDVVDSTYLKESRMRLPLRKGTNVKNMKGETVGRSFQGMGPHEGRSFMIRKDSDEVSESTPQGRKTISLAEFKSTAKEDSKGYASYMAQKGLSDSKKAELEKSSRKDMSDENVAKLSASLKAMQKQK